MYSKKVKIEMKSNRLQFIHHDEIFSTREEALAYVTGGRMQFQYPALYAEPMVLKYKSKTEGEPNVILALGSVGDGTANQNNKVFFIDTANLQKSIDEIIEQLGGNCGDVAEIKKTIGNIIKSCGLNEDGTYRTDLSDDLLKVAKSLYEADTVLSKAIQDEVERSKAKEAAITIKPKDTSSIAFTSNEGPTGTMLSADVKLAPNKIVGKTSLSNIILQEPNGLFSSVEVRYEANKLIVSINGDVTEYDLPEEVYLESGRYDKSSESLILALNNGKNVSIDVAELIGEVNVSSNQTSPVVLKKTRSVDGVDELSADVKISGLDNNILEQVDTDGDGKFVLYVNGQASNIKCLIDGKPSTVQEAIDKSINKISKLDNNIITEKADGIYAAVGLNYDPTLNVLTFDDGVNESKKIQLNATSVLERAYYSQGEIILVFRLANGTTSEVRLDIKDIVNDFNIDNTNRTVTLVRNQLNGQYMLSGDVNVSLEADNILQVNKHSLYVKGVASNIKVDGTSETVADALNKLNAPADTVGSVRNLIQGEALKRAEGDKALQDQIDANKHNFDGEVQDITNKITQETTRATQAETQITNSLNAEVIRATKSEADNKAAINAEVERAKSAEATNSDMIKAEEARAIAAETKNADSIKVINGIDSVEGSVLNSIKKNNASLAYSDTAVDNHYVSAVNQTNGKINVVRKALPNYSNVYEPIGKALEEITKLNSTVNGETANNHVRVEINQSQGKLASVSISENDIASDSSLQAEIARAKKSENDTIDIINGITLTKRPDNDLCYGLMVNGREQGTINIPKDQFLKSVVYEPKSQVLTFVFVTKDGEQTTNIDMSKLVDTYLAGDGLEFNSVDTNKFQIKLNSASETKYISVDSNGILVTGIEAINQKALANETAIAKLNGTADGSVKKSIETALASVYNTDEAIEGQYVASVSQTNGKISVSRKPLPVCNIVADNKGNSPINVTVNQTQGGETTIGATLNVSKEDGNLITADNGTVYASNNAVNHYGVYRANKKSMQEILNIISGEIDNAGGGGVDPALESRVKALEDAIQAINARMDELEKQIQATGDYGEYAEAMRKKMLY